MFLIFSMCASDNFLKLWQKRLSQYLIKRRKEEKKFHILFARINLVRQLIILTEMYYWHRQKITFISSIAITVLNSAFIAENKCYIVF